MNLFNSLPLYNFFSFSIVDWEQRWGVKHDLLQLCYVLINKG